MNDLPEGFSIVQPGPGAAAPSDLPPGFQLVQPGSTGGSAPPVRGQVVHTTTGNEQAPEAPNALESFGHGMSRTVDGVRQLWKEIQAASSGPDLESTVTGKTKAQQELERFTAQLNDEEANYQKGRGPGAGIDWASLAGSATIAAPTLAIPGAEAGLAARFAAGAGAGALDAGAQPTATGKLSDRAINTAVGGAVGGVAAPAVGAVSNKLVDALNAARNRAAGIGAQAGGKATPSAVHAAVPEIADAQAQVAAAARPHVDPSTGQPVMPSAQAIEKSQALAVQLDTLIADGQKQIKTTGQLDSAALGRKANLIANGLTPTKSMVTRDAADWTLERNLQKIGGPDAPNAAASSELTSIYSGNDKTMSAKLADMVGKQGNASQESRAMTVMGGLDELSRASQKDVSEVYGAVRDASGEKLAGNGEAIAKAIDDLRLSPKADPMVDAAVRKLKANGMMDADGNLYKARMTVSEAESLRQHMNAQGSGYGKSQIINAIDADVMQGAGADMFQGARAAAKARFDMLKNPATQKALDNLGELSQGKTAQNYIQQQIVRGADQDVSALLATIKNMPTRTQGSVMGALRGGVLDHLADAAASGENKISGAKLGTAIDKIGENKLRGILGDDLYTQLTSFAKAAKDATYEPDYSAVNHSHSGTTLLSMIQSARAIPGVPLVVNQQAEKAIARRAASSTLGEIKAATPDAPRKVVSKEMRAKIAAALARATAPTAGRAFARSGQNPTQQPQ